MLNEEICDPVLHLHSPYTGHVHVVSWGIFLCVRNIQNVPHDCRGAQFRTTSISRIERS